MSVDRVKNQEKTATVWTIRTMLLIIFLLGVFGTGAELLLLNHVESIWQWVPLILISLSVVLLGCHLIGWNAVCVRIFQGTMLAFIFAGLAGFYFHHRGSAEFKLESNPSLTGWALFWEAIRAKAPPALAPGLMIQLGLIGLAYSYRHPARALTTRQSNTTEGERYESDQTYAD
jgi:uncharacterized membrane protein YoaK (UPF0700 family)